MCGIAGYLGTGNEGTLEAMTRALSRRGPDDHGVYSGGGFGLAHTRLSIIDLSSAGHQPMKGERSVVAFNGEIYNYRQIRDDIERAGAYTFRTESDTETILAVFEVYGVEGFAKLDGMFAFALYDAESGTIHLVRDRMGKKPLYWCVFDGTLIFGSELKALMCHPSFKKEIDHESLSQYLAHEYIPTPRSIFAGVHKIPPASRLAFTAGGAPVIVPYWERPRAAITDSFDEAVRRTDELMRAGVEKRLVSDVPVGVFLSGGIDSTAVAYYAQLAGATRTFSIGFDDKDFDESAYAAEAAHALGTMHTAERFSANACVAMVPDVFAYLDEPMADASILPTYLLSGFARKHVTVALGGDGGDELFAGYPTFHAEALAGGYRAIPEFLRTGMIEPLIRSLPSSDSYMSLDFRLKKFIEGAGAPDHERHQRWLGAFTDDRERAAIMLRTEELSPFSSHRAHFTKDRTRGDYLNSLLWDYARSYMMDEVLVKVDRASMAHGLEVRTPLLDTALVEYVSGLPYSFKHSRMTGKVLLKKVMRGKIPDHIIDRKKKGFGIPLARWLRTDMNALMHEHLSDEAIERTGVFNSAVVRRLIDEHEQGARDHRKKLWTLMVFQMWHNAWAK